MTKVRDLIMNNNWYKIQNFIDNSIYIEYHQYNDYLKKVYEFLINICKDYNDLKIKDNNFIIKMEKVDSMEEFEETFYTCTAYKENDLDGIGYSLSTIDWVELVDYNIDVISLQKYHVSLIILCILYEITWYGFTYDEVKKNIEKQKEESH